MILSSGILNSLQKQKMLNCTIMFPRWALQNHFQVRNSQNKKTALPQQDKTIHFSTVCCCQEGEQNNIAHSTWLNCPLKRSL